GRGAGPSETDAVKSAHCLEFVAAARRLGRQSHVSHVAPFLGQPNFSDFVATPPKRAPGNTVARRPTVSTPREPSAPLETEAAPRRHSPHRPRCVGHSRDFVPDWGERYQKLDASTERQRGAERKEPLRTGASRKCRQ